MSNQPGDAIDLVADATLPTVLTQAIGQAICDEFDLHSDDDKRRFARDLLAARELADTSDASREASQAIALAMLDPTLCRFLVEALHHDLDDLREQSRIVLRMLQR